MKSTDKILIQNVAELWIAVGGESVGEEWRWQNLRDEVKELKDAK